MPKGRLINRKAGFCSPYNELISCFSSSSTDSFEKLLQSTTLTDFNGSISAVTGLLDPKTSVEVMRKAIDLKALNDPRARGHISREAVRLVSDSVVGNLPALSASDLMVLIRGVSDNAKCLDEFLMFKIAREARTRIEEFSIPDIVEMAKAYCTRELDDEELLTAISARMISDPTVQFHQLVSVLRSLSKINLRDEQLIRKTIQSLPVSKSLWEKDAISLLIALVDLDYKDATILDILWEKFEDRKQSISHDDEYNILFCHIWFSSQKECSLQKIVSRASKQNRIKKRLQLLLDCMHYGLVEKADFLDNLPNPSPPARRPRGTKGKKWSSSSDDIALVSSGLHLEVSSVLESMGYETFLEVPASSFIIDTVVRKVST